MANVLLLKVFPFSFFLHYNDLVEEGQKRGASRIRRDFSPSVDGGVFDCHRIQTGREKDRIRVHMLRDEAGIDYLKLDDILLRHSLREEAYHGFDDTGAPSKP